MTTRITPRDILMRKPYDFSTNAMDALMLTLSMDASIHLRPGPEPTLSPLALRLTCSIPTLIPWWNCKMTGEEIQRASNIITFLVSEVRLTRLVGFDSR